MRWWKQPRLELLAIGERLIHQISLQIAFAGRRCRCCLTVLLHDDIRGPRQPSEIGTSFNGAGWPSLDTSVVGHAEFEANETPREGKSRPTVTADQKQRNVRIINYLERNHGASE
ncbi:methionine sulfoxide reductase B [Anopheles sinensis]|uniref:Methionine sulfoxide reductase B n=1 Tax=Anopheles sinensis TaxID=74873 RepID=A0A084VIJ4_ANOSI|nr:methionine sulfoxide reductase B [Anopheles sinensis]